MPAGVDQAAPEVEVFPAAGDVGVAAHGLPGLAAHQRHGIDVVATLEDLLLPGQIAHEVAWVVAAGFRLHTDQAVDHGAAWVRRLG